MLKEKIKSVVWMVELYSYELKYRNEIECYDKVMELYPYYFTIWFIIGLGYKQRRKNIFIGANYPIILVEI
jgi:hypothetical protein